MSIILSFGMNFWNLSGTSAPDSFTKLRNSFMKAASTVDAVDPSCEDDATVDVES